MHDSREASGFVADNKIVRDTMILEQSPDFLKSNRIFVSNYVMVVFNEDQDKVKCSCLDSVSRSF